jgi:hypothetical protein
MQTGNAMWDADYIQRNDPVTYISNYSSRETDNATQGKLMGGILMNEYDPEADTPKLATYYGVSAPRFAGGVERYSSGKQRKFPNLNQKYNQETYCGRCKRNNRNTENPQVEQFRDDNIVLSGGPGDDYSFYEEKFCVNEANTTLCIVLIILLLMAVGYCTYNYINNNNGYLFGFKIMDSTV